jgi:hypothetical protein
MTLFKNYREYIRDNPKGYWFKRKLYGWGWVPAKWEGWLILLCFVFSIIGNVFELAEMPIPTDDAEYSFFIKIILSLVLFIVICYYKGEKPGWQWGLKK